ncbi:MAG: hypothetical protein Q8O88_01075 [bacterium]|nr:hypothetical protein [bacterium]
MKRSFGISIKRSKDYQSIEINESFEDEFSSEKDFDKLKKETIERVHIEADKQLAGINPKPDTKKKPITLEVN